MFKQLIAKLFTKAAPVDVAEISLKARTRLPVTAEEVDKAKEILENREAYTMPEYRRAYYTVHKYGAEVQKRRAGRRTKDNFSEKSMDELLAIAMSSKTDYYKKQKACQAIYSLGFRNGRKATA